MRTIPKFSNSQVIYSGSNVNKKTIRIVGIQSKQHLPINNLDVPLIMTKICYKG
jgi:hypothetical protein